MVGSQLFADVSALELKAAPLQQLTREHILAQAMLSRGDYEEGRFAVVAPVMDPGIASACGRYAAHLSRPAEAQVRFEAWTLERLVETMRQCGAREIADAIFLRYLDWKPLERLWSTNCPPICTATAKPPASRPLPEKAREPHGSHPRSGAGAVLVGGSPVVARKRSNMGRSSQPSISH